MYPYPINLSTLNPNSEQMIQIWLVDADSSVSQVGEVFVRGTLSTIRILLLILLILNKLNVKT